MSKISVNEYRDHATIEVVESEIGKKVVVAGWVHSIRDHGGITFIDLRDHYGLVQLVVNDPKLIEGVCKETTISVSGLVRGRTEENYNLKLVSGKVEIVVDSLRILGGCEKVLPFEIADSENVKEDLRLKYRFLDLRNPENHRKIVLRSELLHFTRNKMHDLGFTEVQTPILTSSSPEGARDFLVPSRLNPGKFYALPQAPQQFKQLLMCSGFDRYFQIAPCFRDEDARADRSPGEFYQMDMEMSFATQEDIFKVIEDVLYSIFTEFSDLEVTKPPFVRIPYKVAMDKYCSDKPDLRNPLICHDMTEIFKNTTFGVFQNNTVKAICASCGDKPRRWFDSIVKFITDNEGKGLGYMKYDENMVPSGAVVKFFSEEELEAIKKECDAKPNDVVFFIADKKNQATKLTNILRNKLGTELDLIDKSKFAFCWIVDFPFFEEDEETGDVAFSHNPFSMPQGGMNALLNDDPYSIVAYQYDAVLNGVELASGAVRNHEPEVMKKAFNMAGYSDEVVESKFPALYNAFHYGAPPHAGLAFGFDRVAMFLCGIDAIRDVIAFPLNSKAQDIMMGAPSEVTEKQLREAHIKCR